MRDLNAGRNLDDPQHATSGEVVRALWQSIEARNWAAAGRLLAEDVSIYWPHTGETIRGRDNYLGLNREYPEGWSIEVLSVVPAGDQAAIEARVPHQRLGVSFVAGFYRVGGGLIADGTEYWVDEASQTPPDWRQRYTERAAPG